MQIAHYVLLVTIFVYDKWLKLCGLIKRIGDSLMSYALNDTFTEINFYDIYDTNSQIILYNNTFPLRLFWLSFLKAFFGYSIHSSYSDLKEIDGHSKLSSHMFDYNIMEIVYYKDGEIQRYFAKNHTDLEAIQYTLKHHPNLPHHNNKYLHASLCDIYTITDFINSHIFCFTRENGITVEDVYNIYTTKFVTEGVETVPPMIYANLLEDDTLEETTYINNERLILYEI